MPFPTSIFVHMALTANNYLHLHFCFGLDRPCKGISADRILALVHISCLSSTPMIGCYLGRTYHICTYPTPPSPFQQSPLDRSGLSPHLGFRWTSGCSYQIVAQPPAYCIYSPLLRLSSLSSLFYCLLAHPPLTKSAASPRGKLYPNANRSRR